VWHGRLRLYVGQLRPQGAEGDHGPSWGAIATAGTHGAARHGRVATDRILGPTMGRRDGDMAPQWAGVSILASGGPRQPRGTTGHHAEQRQPRASTGPHGAARGTVLCTSVS